jgi:hypothetical protein
MILVGLSNCSFRNKTVKYLRLDVRICLLECSSLTSPPKTNWFNYIRVATCLEHGSIARKNIEENIEYKYLYFTTSNRLGKLARAEMQSFSRYTSQKQTTGPSVKMELPNMEQIKKH